jgi:hypothetical protein
MNQLRDVLFMRGKRLFARTEVFPGEGFFPVGGNIVIPEK